MPFSNSCFATAGKNNVSMNSGKGLSSGFGGFGLAAGLFAGASLTGSQSLR
jgi:hypothetical protein